MTALKWIKARLSERSTWVGVGMAVTAASALPHPWGVMSFIAGVIAAFVPDGQM